MYRDIFTQRYIVGADDGTQRRLLCAALGLWPADLVRPFYYLFITYITLHVSSPLYITLAY